MFAARGLSALLIVSMVLPASALVAATAPTRQAKEPTLEQRLIADARDGALDQHSLARAALIASGLYDIKDLQRLEQQIQQLANELRGSVLFTGDAVEKARVLHEFLHAHVLHRYDANATDLRRAFDGGEYNCLTATVLYIAVGRQCGLDLAAEQSRGHVRCVLSTAGSEYAIETTQTTWPTASTTASQRRLREANLLAMFYFNRGHSLHGEGRFDDAVRALVVARELDPECPEVQGNLQATLQHWAQSRDEAGDLAGAALVRARAQQLAPHAR